MASVATPTVWPTYTPAPHTASTATADDGQPEYVPAAFEATSLGQAVLRYNAAHRQKITMHVVGRDSQGVDRAMYQDLVARQWRIMGPEDFPQSADKSGWPYLVIALQDTLDANSVAGWGYVLEHEWVHMVAAANLATAGLNLAELMRSPDGSFSHQARFHEVCADFYPRDPNGEHRPVAAFYGALQRMPELLRVLSAFEPPALAYQPAAEYQVLAITGLPLVDAACVWDRAAMQAVRRLYDERQGTGAFNLLFPGY